MTCRSKGDNEESRNHRAPWTKKDVERLAKLGKAHTASEIAYILGRTIGAVQTQAQERESGMYASRRQARGSSYAGAVITPLTRKMSVHGAEGSQTGNIRWDPVPGWEAEEMIVNGEKTLWVKKVPAVPGGMRKKWQK